MSSLSARLAALALALSASPAFACSEDEGFMFSCETAVPGRSLAICGKAEGDGDGLNWTTARFLYSTEKGEEISFPADPAMGPKELFFSHLFRNDFYEATVRFAADGVSYRLFFRDATDNAESGLEISRDGQVAETLMCGERPLAYFDAMRKLLACDTENPHGAQGCSDTPPNIK